MNSISCFSLGNSMFFIVTYLRLTKLATCPVGYLYNYQTKEFFNLSYVHEPPEGPAKFGGEFTYSYLNLCSYAT